MTSRIPLLVLLLSAAPLPVAAQQPLTVAEKSNYTTTSRHAEVMDFCQALAKASPVVRLAELGISVQGRKLPLLILADPPVSTPEQAAASGKLVVFAQGNIHGGEVDGKEALLMLARQIATGKERALLKDLIVVVAPLVNADGGEKMAKTNRTSQNGPPAVGERANADGFDLNRDFIKLETPEVQALVRFYRKWDPALVIDTHTTNGSLHRYTITYDGPRNPATRQRLRDEVRDWLLPSVTKSFEKQSGYKAFFYGNFAKGHTVWEPYPALPRYGTQYVGLRNRIGILVESYSYAPYKDRVLASRDFVRACLELAASAREPLQQLLAGRGRRDVAWGGVPLRHDQLALAKRVKILGFVEERKGGKVVPGKPRDYEVEYMGEAWIIRRRGLPR